MGTRVTRSNTALIAALAAKNVAQARIVWEPLHRDNTDSTAWSITATSEPGSADVSDAGWAPPAKPAEITVNYMALRVIFTVGAFAGGCTTLNYRIKVNGTSKATGTLPASTATTVVVNLTANFYTNGTAQTVEYFFWVDAGNAAITSIQTQEGFGITGATYTESILQIATGNRLAYVIYQTQAQGTTTGICDLRASNGVTIVMVNTKDSISTTLLWSSPVLVPVPGTLELAMNADADGMTYVRRICIYPWL